MTDIICIGHVTKDRIVTPQAEVYLPGGTTYYFSHGINHLGNKQVSYKLIASLADEDLEAIDDMRRQGIEVDVIRSRQTVFFENIYGTIPNTRKQRVRAKADPFTVESLAGVEARYIVVGSLLADDFSTDVLQHLSKRGTLVVDAQGYLREVRGDKVFATDWADKQQALQYVDILKVNEEEMWVLTGIEDFHEACRQLAAWGVGEVLLTLGDFGSIVYSGGQFYDIPAYRPLNIVDATGCGDTYVMGYVYKRAQGATPAEAGRFAAAVSSIKLEKSGPFTGTEAQVAERMSRLA